MTGAAGVNEARIAFALMLDPALRSSRSLERASGLSRITVLETVPEAHEVSALLSTGSRGSSAFKNSSPMQVTLRPRQEALHRTNISFLERTTDQGTSSPTVPLVSFSPKSIETSSLKAEEVAALDPSLDLWSNAEQVSVGSDRAGGRGWLLALVYGFGPVEVQMAELMALWGLSERGTRDAVSRLVRAGWLSRRKLGRRSVVTIDFSRLPQYMDEGLYGWDDRAGRRSEIHGLEVTRFARRHTPVGFRAWLVLRGRAAKLLALPEGVCRIWQRLLASATEEEIYEILSTTPARPTARTA